MRRGYLLIFFSPSRASNACERCGEFPRAPTSKPSHRDWNSPSLSSRSSRGRPGRNTGKRLKISAIFLGCNRTMKKASARGAGQRLCCLDRYGVLLAGAPQRALESFYGHFAGNHSFEVRSARWVLEIANFKVPVKDFTDGGQRIGQPFVGVGNGNILAAVDAPDISTVGTAPGKYLFKSHDCSVVEPLGFSRCSFRLV